MRDGGAHWSESLPKKVAFQKIELNHLKYRVGPGFLLFTWSYSVAPT